MTQGVELIERLLPKLPIRDRCCIEVRFLWVRGSSEDLPDKVSLPFEAETYVVAHPQQSVSAGSG